MSDCGYDNVELSELINDLKNVGRNGNSMDQDHKIKFQHSSSSALLERRMKKSSFYDSNHSSNSSALLEKRKPLYHDLDNNSLQRESCYDNFRIEKYDSFNRVNQSKIKYDDSDDLRVELSMVKEELAMLKRTSSLAGHPIFGNPNASNEIVGAEKCKRMMGSSQHNLQNSLNMNSTIPKNYKINYGSSSNVAYHNPPISKFQYQSLNRLNTSPAFSAHRDNIEKIRRANSLAVGTTNQDLGPKHMIDYYEETEDCTLQPIGKGIQTLTGSATSISKIDQLNNKNNFRDTYVDEMKAIKKTKLIWLQLDSSRESCKRKLLNKEAGSFIIRIQSGYKFSGGLMFELVLKISNNQNSQIYEEDNFEYFPLKEFSETNIKGIKLIGHSLEPMFYSIDSFVERHLETPLGLPCCLKLPMYSTYEDKMKFQSPFNRQNIARPFNILSKKISGSLTSLSSIKSQFTISTYAEPSQEKIEMKLYFLGKVKVDRLNGPNAVRHAVDKSLNNDHQPKHCIEIDAHFDSLSGITLVDNERIFFFKKLLSPNSIIVSCVDPLHRGLNSDYLITKGLKNSKIFGIVCHKKKILLKEHQVYLFGEFNTQMQMEKVIRFINKHFINQSLKKY